MSASAPTIGDDPAFRSASGEVDGSSSAVDESRRRASTGRRRKRSQNRHERATTFCGDAVINRLAGPDASTRMIANGQIHRGVQKVPTDPQRSVVLRRGRASAGLRTHRTKTQTATKVTSKPQPKHTVTGRPSSAPSGRLGISSDKGEPMMMVSVSKISALEERCRILEESLLKPDTGRA